MFRKINIDGPSGTPVQLKTESEFSVIAHSQYSRYSNQIYHLLSGKYNVVSQCLGKLTLMDPAALLSNLKQSLSSQSSLTRSTVVTAIKFTISDQVNIIQLKWGFFQSNNN